MTPDQAASVRMMLAKFGRKVGTGLEELWIHKLAQAGEIRIFMQIGANDGYEADPMASIIRRYRLQGVLVEPIPYFCDKLQRRYQDRPDVTIVNMAVAEVGETSKPFYHLAFDDPSLPGWANGLGSFSRAVLLSHADRIADIETKIITTTVPCLGFNELVARCNLPHLDLLVTDTEGYDYQILKQVELATLRPKLVIFESKHLSSAEQEMSAKLFGSSGYRCIATSDNTMAFRNDIAAKWRLRA